MATDREFSEVLSVSTISSTRLSDALSVEGTVHAAPYVPQKKKKGVLSALA